VAGQNQQGGDDRRHLVGRGGCNDRFSRAQAALAGVVWSGPAAGSALVLIELVTSKALSARATDKALKLANSPLYALHLSHFICRGASKTGQVV